MKIEKEQVQLKNIQLQAGSSGGRLSVVDSRQNFNLNALQFSYLEVLKNAGSIESLVQFFLGQGWLVNFRELFSLMQFLVQENIVTNPAFKNYFNAAGPAEGSVTNIFSSSGTSASVSADQLPFFRSLEKSVATYLLKGAQKIAVPAQTRVTKAGARDRDLFILLKGQAAIYKVQDEKHRQLVATLGAGALFGEKAFLLNQPRTADIITTTACELLRIPHLPEFDAYIKSDKAQSLQHRFWVLQALASSPFFKDLPSDSLDSLIFSGKLCQAPANQVLFHEGQPGNTCYILIQGNVVISQKGKNINVLNQGACFGEISLLMSGGVRTATIKTQQDSVLLEIAQTDFYRVLSQNLILAKEIESLAALRLQNDQVRR